MDLRWKDRDEYMRCVTFVCPECRSQRVGTAGWKEWCANHETTCAVDDLGVVVTRRLVEMKPLETVSA